MTAPQIQAASMLERDFGAAERWLKDRDLADHGGATRFRDLGRELGPLLPVAVAVVGRHVMASEWAKRAGENPEEGLALLRAALNASARFYGLTAPAPEPTPAAEGEALNGAACMSFGNQVAAE